MQNTLMMMMLLLLLMAGHELRPTDDTYANSKRWTEMFFFKSYQV